MQTNETPGGRGNAAVKAEEERFLHVHAGVMPSVRPACPGHVAHPALPISPSPSPVLYVGRVQEMLLELPEQMTSVVRCF